MIKTYQISFTLNGRPTYKGITFLSLGKKGRLKARPSFPAQEKDARGYRT